MKEFDSEGKELKKTHPLKRQVYVNQSPAWHLDGYDQLNNLFFVICRTIEVYIRKVLWLKMLSLINSLSNIATLCLNCVEKLQGAPVKIITDMK